MIEFVFSEFKKEEIVDLPCSLNKITYYVIIRTKIYFWSIWYLLSLQYSVYSSAHIHVVLQNDGRLFVNSSDTIGLPVTATNKRRKLIKNKLTTNLSLQISHLLSNGTHNLSSKTSAQLFLCEYVSFSYGVKPKIPFCVTMYHWQR